jgi:hypothetical protein
VFGGDDHQNGGHEVGLFFYYCHFTSFATSNINSLNHSFSLAV